MRTDVSIEEAAKLLEEDARCIRSDAVGEDEADWREHLTRLAEALEMGARALRGE